MQLISAFVFRYKDSAIPLNLNLQAYNHLLCLYSALFVSDFVGNLEDRLSHDAAQFMDTQNFVAITLKFDQIVMFDFYI